MHVFEDVKSFDELLIMTMSERFWQTNSLGHACGQSSSKELKQYSVRLLQASFLGVSGEVIQAEKRYIDNGVGRDFFDKPSIMTLENQYPPRNL